MFRILPFILLIGVASSAACAQTASGDSAPIAATSNASARCVVERIIDGDTFICEGDTRIRLLIVDADEPDQSVYSDSATMLLEQLMPVGSTVRLEYDLQTHDRYRRVLAYVHAGDRFVNRELARRGLARIAVYPPNVKRVDELRAAADSAQMERIGVWSSSAFECEPRAWRAGRC